MKAWRLALCLLLACAPASELVRSDPEPQGPNCANGGTAIHEGVDDDGDGLLDDDEIDATTYVCNGTPGTAALVVISAEAPGVNCTNGGSAVRTGTDVNANSVLDDDEVQQTIYVCNGVDGSSQLVTTVQEPAGVNCTMGGIAILVGTDTDHDGMLDANEVTSTSYVCDGA
jgi:hypothetical protein